jgi:hypothetical protein
VHSLLLRESVLSISTILMMKAAAAVERGFIRTAAAWNRRTTRHTPCFNRDTSQQLQTSTTVNKGNNNCKQQ